MEKDSRGRPKKEVKRSKEYRIRLLPEEYEHIKILSEQSGTTMANVIRSCVNLVDTLSFIGAENKE